MRSILHCDLNNFFASVEMLSRPELKSVPMAVAGDTNKRHGIILAKNELAKKYGIYTPETVYSALNKCPNLVLVKPHYDEYVKYSKLVNEVYQKYTDRVEKFGIDESFLDITESIGIFGSPYEIAYKIKEEIKTKFKLTISVGVSFNKSLAKLGSDLKKPDAITVLDEENYKKKIYDLPVEMLLYVGNNTKQKLNRMGIKTIGDLAIANKYRLEKRLGKIGIQVYNYANGLDDSPVKFYYEKDERKSISKGITFENDIIDIFELEKILRNLAAYVSKKLRDENLKCGVVGITFKDSNFNIINRQKKILYTNLYSDISNMACTILNENYIQGRKVRAITLFANELQDEKENVQLNIFNMLNNSNLITENKENLEKVSKTVDNLSDKYGKDIIKFGSTINLKKEERRK